MRAALSLMRSSKGTVSAGSLDAYDVHGAERANGCQQRKFVVSCVQVTPDTIEVGAFGLVSGGIQFANQLFEQRADRVASGGWGVNGCHSSHHAGCTVSRRFRL